MLPAFRAERIARVVAAISALALKSAAKTAASQATRLVVPSNATRSELVRVLGIDPGRIDVAYHGVDHRLFQWCAVSIGECVFGEVIGVQPR